MQARQAPRLILWILLASGLLAGTGYAIRGRMDVGVQPDGRILVPTGQMLTPAGTHVEVSDRPLGMVKSPDGSQLAVVTGSNFGQRSLHLIGIASKTVEQTISIGNSFVGVEFSPGGDILYVGGGASNEVKFFKRAADGSFAADGALAFAGGAPSGLDLSADGSRLYVALNLVNQVAVIDTASRTVVAQVPVGTYPYTVVLSADGSKAYVSNWGGRIPGPGDTTDGLFPVAVDPRTGIPISGTVSVLATASNTVVKTIEVGLHPSGMARSPQGDRVYVTNANSDTVSVIDTASDTVVKTLHVGRVGPGRAPVLGSSPNAVTVSADGKTLYVANASENAVAVVNAGGNQGKGKGQGDDTNVGEASGHGDGADFGEGSQDEGKDHGQSHGKGKVVRGLIPTGWYPTAVTLDPSGSQILIASGYGFGSIAPTPPSRTGRSYQDRKGVISFLTVPSPAQLEELTAQVRRNNRSLPPGGGHPHGGNNPVPMHHGQKSPIKHVFYIIKENRTYDQVFGALPQGKGDPSLVQFGRDVTPNHHALAEQFVLLDNFYGPGDQSALGHRWCLQAYPSTWTHKYSNARNNQNPMLLGPTDAIYDSAKLKGLAVRAYGERGRNIITPTTATWTDIYNDWKNGTQNVDIKAEAVIVGLRDVYHPRYPAAEGRILDQYRADIFLEELAEFEKNGNLPNLILMLLYEDHTEGTSPGFPTPRAMVADNDLALGRVVEAISKSRFWPESAIFVTEDDSQNGLDHVDGHRTVGFVISPYTRRGGHVDSTMYTIINMYRTMEQILGLPPVNQFDLAAEPMFSVFTHKPDFAPYTALPVNIPLDEMNPSLAGLKGLQRELAKFSLTIDSSEPDTSDANLLNRAIWHSVKGFDVPYNYGRPIARRHDSFLSLLQVAGP